MSRATLHPPYSESTPLPQSGKVMYYNPGVMERVLDYRVRTSDIEPCEECAGYVALLRAGDLNRKVWIELDTGEVEGPFLVIDVAQPRHIDMLLERNWVVDVDNDTARRWQMRGPIGGTVLAAPPS